MVSGSQLGLSLVTALTFNVVGWMVPMDAIGQPNRLVFAQDVSKFPLNLEMPLPRTGVLPRVLPGNWLGVLQKPKSVAATPPTVLKPGRYCYQSDGAGFQAKVRLGLNSQGQIQGDAQATIQNPKASYYTSFRQKFQGNLQMRPQGLALAKLVTTTWIEYDVQTDTVTWQVSPQLLKLDDGQPLKAVDCAKINPSFQTQAGLEAADLIRSATAVHRQTVQFKPGERSATLQNSVVRAERDLYQINARGGQEMMLKIQSLEKNAVFDLVSPSGLILVQSASQKQILLQETGNYQVIVGGTRGNATYSLRISIN